MNQKTQKRIKERLDLRKKLDEIQEELGSKKVVIGEANVMKPQEMRLLLARLIKEVQNGDKAVLAEVKEILTKIEAKEYPKAPKFPKIPEPKDKVEVTNFPITKYPKPLKEIKVSNFPKHDNKVEVTNFPKPQKFPEIKIPKPKEVKFPKEIATKQPVVESVSISRNVEGKITGWAETINGTRYAYSVSRDELGRITGYRLNA